MIWLLDTNTISELRKPKPNKAVVDWLAKEEANSIWTSRLCLVEIHFGIELQSDLTQRNLLSHWYHEAVLPMFENKIFEVDEASLKAWLEYLRRAKAKQLAAPPADFLIAATGEATNSIVVTRDVNPYVVCGVPTFNPWTGEGFNGA